LKKPADRFRFGLQAFARLRLAPSREACSPVARSWLVPVLPTRYLGLAPDRRHPLAPPEHVYEVLEPKRFAVDACLANRIARLLIFGTLVLLSSLVLLA
jgi:hypothetical protein